MRRLNRKSQRHYLSGIDWVMTALDGFNKKKTGIGNHSQIVLELAGCPDQTSFTNRLESVLSDCVFYKGKSKRAWHLAPYWRPIQKPFSKTDAHVEDISSENETELERVIEERARTPFRDTCTMIAFDLIRFADRSFILFRFDHRLLDARGAERLLEMILDDTGQNNPHPSTLELPANDARLYDWRNRFLSGRTINRFLRAVYPEGRKAACLKESGSAGVLTHARVRFTEEETRRFDSNTLKKAGYLMGGIYLLSSAATVFDAFFTGKGTPGDMAVPVNMDTRGRKFTAGRIFFNRISFLIFHLKHGSEKTENIRSAKHQFVEQIKQKIPDHFKNATLLMRIAPAGILGFFMGKTMKRHPYAFSFSYIPEQAFHLEKVFGFETADLCHMPVVPFEPGIGVYFTRFNDRLNLVMSGYSGKIKKEDLISLAGAVKKEVLYG
ncbi:MAG: hypothetical protein K9J83_05675 [Desulfarculaceae bacterium]|nr:hypothetical protein [Desulfarculaceae bacterium]